MTKVAICDDEISELSNLTELLNGYRLEKNSIIEYTTYQSPFELVCYIEDGIIYDVIFLDIMMGSMTGIDAAKEIRKYDTNAIIVFLTSTPDFAVQSYQVEAFFYQMKPVTKEGFTLIMDRIMEKRQKQEGEVHIIKSKNGIFCVELAQLEYCESIGKTLVYHMAYGKEVESFGSMKELMISLNEYKQFMQIHRSYLVNAYYIQNLTAQCVEMRSGVKLPIPHGKYNECKDRYLEFCFKEEKR